ncbi:MAG: hypothetical protein CBE35_00320 [Candidatus Pelagibacter sp. TMED275]|nr:MAG: hypothetical protein CBE35_00320 [Candidatus Pelagibacter sp. TMED275]|tara:strand:- start:1038 stop:1274 length:237 start_codon:yes stop_codon:yes gene_type:complete
MLTYIIFFIIACILVFIIYIGAKGLSRGIDAKSKLKESKLKRKKNLNISNELMKLNDLKNQKVINEKEFQTAKKKLLE